RQRLAQLLWQPLIGKQHLVAEYFLRRAIGVRNDASLKIRREQRVVEGEDARKRRNAQLAGFGDDVPKPEVFRQPQLRNGQAEADNNSLALGLFLLDGDEIEVVQPPHGVRHGGLQLLLVGRSKIDRICCELRETVSHLPASV